MSIQTETWTVDHVTDTHHAQCNEKKAGRMEESSFTLNRCYSIDDHSSHYNPFPASYSDFDSTKAFHSYEFTCYDGQPKMNYFFEETDCGKSKHLGGIAFEFPMTTEQPLAILFDENNQMRTYHITDTGSGTLVCTIATCRDADADNDVWMYIVFPVLFFIIAVMLYIPLWIRFAIKPRLKRQEEEREERAAAREARETIVV